MKRIVSKLTETACVKQSGAMGILQFFGSVPTLTSFLHPLPVKANRKSRVLGKTIVSDVFF